MMKLERLRVDKFRNVKPGSEVRFADGFNIVLGRNGTGKTTLLDLISRIVRWDFSDLEGEEFAINVELRADDSRIDAYLSNFAGEHGRFVQELHFQLSSHGKVIQIENADGRFYVDGVLQEVYGSASNFNHGLGYLVDKLVDCAFSFVGGSVRLSRFDESLDLFRLTWDARSFPGRMVFTSSSKRVVGMQDIPSTLFDLLLDHHQHRAGFTSFTTTHDHINFLAKAVKSMGFVSAELRIDALGRSGTKSSGDVELGNMIARFFFADGGFITQDRLSYGQKRLLMFYYYLASNPDIVIADELVNGLHHQWITACIDEIGDRQAFLTSQNPLLLDYLPFSSAEQVRKSFVLCTSELDENKKPVWTWSNMSEEASNEFYSAYHVGIEHVSEILQSQGLF